EVLCGFSRAEFSRPVQYPIACHPQAWASGATPLMLKELLGLRARGLDNVLEVDHPALPDSINKLELRGLRIGASSLDMTFSRNRRGDLDVRVGQKSGNVDVRINKDRSRDKH